MTEQAINYGDALYELCLSEGLTQKVLRDLSDVTEIFDGTPDYLKLLSEPSLPKEERCGLLDKAFRGNVQQYTLNFMKILTERGMIRELKDCALRFRERFNQDNGIAEVSVCSAVPLSDRQQEALLEKLQDITGKQISMRLTTDPALIGGIRLSMNNREFDGTVQGRLQTLSRILRETTL